MHFKDFDFEKIAEKQDSYLDDNCNGTIPLNEIPELTHSIFEESVDWKEVNKHHKNLNRNSTPNELADGVITMYEQSDICIDGNEKKRGNWYVFFDMGCEIHWKCKKWPEDLALDVFTDYVLGD